MGRGTLTLAAKIIDRGRGSKITGMRSILYDIMDAFQVRWRSDQIAALFRRPPGAIR